jgi:DNA-binding transcriptional LysR family regulator
MTSTRIGIVGERIPDFPPHVATGAALEHTAVRVTLLEGSDSEVLDWLRTGAVDMAIVATDEDDLQAAPLAGDDLLAVVAVDHPLAGREAVAIADLEGEPFIMPAGGCEPLISALAREAGVRLRRHYEVRDTASITAMVRERLGVTIMPELSIPDDRTGLRALPLDPPARRRLSLAVLHDAEPLPAALALMRLAEDRVRSAVGADDQAL